MNRFILVGHSASGKDYMAMELQKLGYTKSVSYTTRPIRKGEVNGIDYNFISIDDFKKMIDDDKMYNYEVFKGDWYYGDSIDNWDKDTLFIKNTMGVNKIKKEDRDKCIVIYLNIPEQIRRDRLSRREDSNDSIERRISSDKKDFDGFVNWDIMITSEIEVTILINKIKNGCGNISIIENHLKK